MPFTINTDGVSASLTATLNAGEETAFLRYAKESETDEEWKRIIPNRPGVIERRDDPEDPPKKLVYDWRLGVPHLMQLIGLRLQIIAALDPNFWNNMVYRSELERHRSHLLTQYNTMIEGISCNFLPVDDDPLWFIHNENTGRTLSIACADIYTGTMAISKIETDAYSFFYALGYWLSEIDRIEHDLRHQVMLKLPLFEMRSMIDTLSLYARGEPDLTEGTERISLELNPNLCLDMQWSNPASGTPVWLWDCTGSDTQLWVYDRKSGLIHNPVYDKCLDVQWGNPASGTPVWLWDCTGSDAQSWTYDPEGHVLTNALGTVLQINVPPNEYCDHYVTEIEHSCVDLGIATSCNDQEVKHCASYQYSFDYSHVEAQTPVFAGTWYGTGDPGEPNQQWISPR